MGIDHIWIPPGCKGMDPNGNGYDIYDLFDLGEFDQKGAISTKWGSFRELQEMIREAQSLGVKVIWDAVLNHKAGADYSESFQAIAVDPKGTLLMYITNYSNILIMNMEIHRKKQGYIQSTRNSWLDGL